MDDMEMRDVVQKESALPAKEIAIYCRRCASLEVPRLAAVMREDRIRVMQEREHDEPVCHHKPWYPIEFNHRRQAPTEHRKPHNISGS